MAKIEIHPWYRQYRKLKAQVPEAILLFRFGDFYETFDDDAKLIAELLDVTLTRKEYAVDKSKPRESQKLYAPMAGMPYHAVERYVSELVSRGYRVAIAEQLTETEATRTDTRPRSVFAAAIQPAAPGAIERKMVHREIVRVITPGTLVEPSMLTTTTNNYLAATLVEGDRIGLAYADLSTGEFAAAEFAGERALQQLQGELARLQAAEVLVPDATDLRPPGLNPAEARLTQDLAPLTKDEREALLPHERVARRLDSQSAARWSCGHVTAWPAWRWDYAEAREVLLRQLRVSALTAFGLDERPLAARAAGALLQYVHETQRHPAAQLNTLRVYSTSSFMFLDPQTRRNLELLEPGRQNARTALVHVLDRTRTPMGARLLRRWIAQPLLELAPLQARQAAVARLVDNSLLRAELREALGAVGDMERALNRIAQGLAVATPRDLVQLRASLRALPTVIAAAGPYLAELIPDDEAVSAAPSQVHRDSGSPDDELFADPPSAASAAPPLDPCTDVLELLEQALDDDPPALLGASNYLRTPDESGERPRRVIRPGFEPRLDELVQASRHAQAFIDRLEARERERTGIKSLKVGYNSVFGYYIEVSRSTDERLIPKDYERKQTLVGAERYITAELKEYEQIIDRAKLQLLELEREAFARICAQVSRHVDRLRRVAQALARLDAVQSLAEAAVRGGYNRPLLNDSTRLRIVRGRHPVVEQMLAAPFVPNDIELDTEESQLLIITGPNMAGKCLSGDTLVFTDQGLLTLAELMPPQAREGAFTPIDRTVQGFRRRGRATHFYRAGRRSTLRLTTQHGFQLEGTPDHRVWARHPDGREGWERLERVQIGDYLALDRRVDLWGNTTTIPPLPDYGGTGRLPTELAPDLAYLMGVLSGTETRTRQGALTFTLRDASLVATVRRIVREQFDVHLALGAHDHEYVIPGAAPVACLAALGMHWDETHAPRVPNAILRAPRTCVVAFIRGFFDAAGQLTADGAVRASVAAEPLARHLHLLLLNLGIVAKLAADHGPHGSVYTLTIDATETDNFFRQVSATGPTEPRNPPLSSTTVTDGLAYDPVVQIAPGSAEVFDLNVDDDHAYVANGIVSHNSTVLRQVALIVLMAQIGSFVPAEYAEVGLVDRIFTRIGAQDDIATGQSTFMVEMTETAALLLQSTRRSLIILDEVGRGTSTYDGMAIARAVVEYIHNEPRLGCRTLFATHYHELTALEGVLQRVRNYHMAAVEKDGQVVFLYELRRGGADRSYGIHVAELAGIPREVTARARALLAELEGRRSQTPQDAQTAAESERDAPERLADDNAPTDDREARSVEPARPSARSSARRQPQTQLSLFDVAPHPVLEYLRRLNINELTPLEALNLLYELQKLAHRQS